MGFVCISVGTILLVIAIKIYVKLNTRWNKSYTCLVGKTAIVTGANTGLGYATALDFAMRGARVILACRNKEKAHEAKRKIISATGNENVIVKILDLTSFDSVREFANDFNGTEDRLDILVNNAGLIDITNGRTKDGFFIAIQGNHLSPFLLTHLLINKLKSAPSSRIVNVSSYSAKMAKLTDPDKLNILPESTWHSNPDMVLYSYSKLCNILFTIELDRKLEGTGIGVYCCHPGATTTDAQGRLTALRQTLYYFTLNYFSWTPEEGAQTQIYCAVSKEVERHKGEMFGNCRKIGLYETANDPSLVKEVWRYSEKIVKLTDSEKLP